MRMSLASFLTVAAMAITSAGLSSPANASTYGEYVRFTNSVLDGFESERGRNAGFRAARAMFNEPRFAQADWNGTGLLCRFFNGDSSANGGKAAANVVWPTEKRILDTFRSAGGSIFDWQDFMLVRFTVLSAGINVQCPRYNSLFMGPFSDVLYSQFTAYRDAQGGSGAPSPVPSASNPEPPPLSVRRTWRGSKVLSSSVTPNGEMRARVETKLKPGSRVKISVCCTGNGGTNSRELVGSDGIVTFTVDVTKYNRISLRDEQGRNLVRWNTGLL